LGTVTQNKRKINCSLNKIIQKLNFLKLYNQSAPKIATLTEEEKRDKRRRKKARQEDRKAAQEEEAALIERGRKARREAAIQSKRRLNEREAYEKQRLQKARDQFDVDFLKPWLENRMIQPFWYVNIGYNDKDNTSAKGELLFLYFFTLIRFIYFQF
jgi:hypothetical protein